MKEDATDVNYLRAKFRWEFLKRNKSFQDALKKEYKSDEQLKSLEIISHFEREFGLPWRRSDVEDAKKAIRGEVDEEFPKTPFSRLLVVSRPKKPNSRKMIAAIAARSIKRIWSGSRNPNLERPPAAN